LGAYVIRETFSCVASAQQARLQAIDQTLDPLAALFRSANPSAANTAVTRPPQQHPWSMVHFEEDLPLAKRALSATPSRRGQLLLVEYDRSPCGNDAATNAMEQ
jgi:hypothetical protein